MTISWDLPYKQKYISFIKTEYTMWSRTRTPLGWDLHLGRLCITYDNYGRVKK
jgi:hypothetical protein